MLMDGPAGDARYHVWKGRAQKELHAGYRSRATQTIKRTLAGVRSYARGMCVTAAVTASIAFPLSSKFYAELDMEGAIGKIREICESRTHDVSGKLAGISVAR